MDQEIQKILLVKLSSIGDVVHSLPILKALRTRYPNAHITWVVKPFCKEIIEGNPYLDEVLIFERGKWGNMKKASSALRDFRRLIREIRERRFDMVVDLQGLFYTGLITFLSGSPIRLGFANAREFSHLFYNRKVRVPTMNLHAVDRYMLMMQALGIQTAQKDFTIRISKQDRQFVQDFLAHENVIAGRAPLIAMNPSARWVTKQWNEEKFAELADALHEQWAANIVFIGSHEDVELVERVRGFMRSSPINTTGKTNLKQLVALLDEADLLVTNDTGPMHIASSVGTPTVSLFGPTDLRRTGPYGPGHVVIDKKVFCSPCFRKRCPNEMLCMEILTTNDVLSALRQGIDTGAFAKISPSKAARLAKAQPLQQISHRPTVDVLILSDGKAGHLNQSLGLVRRLPHVRYRVVDIKFRSTFYRGLAWVAGVCGMGKVNFVRKTLTKESFDAIMESAPRVVLSTGISVAPVNLMLGRIFRARTAVSMKPGPIRLSRYDLAIVPMHDEPPKMPNVVETLGAPNLIDEELLKQEAAKLRRLMNLKKQIRIGVLLGGETRDYYISRETGIVMIGQLKRLCQELDAEVLISTSRRTPRGIEKMIAGAFDGDPACPLMALASANSDNPVPGILGLSDIIVVTEESTSMVSEAASSGKTVVVMRIDRHYKKRLKQERTIQELSKLGYITATESDHLFETVMGLWPPKSPPRILGDTDMAAKALSHLLNQEITSEKAEAEATFVSAVMS